MLIIADYSKPQSSLESVHIFWSLLIFKKSNNENFEMMVILNSFTPRKYSHDFLNLIVRTFMVVHFISSMWKMTKLVGYLNCNFSSGAHPPLDLWPESPPPLIIFLLSPPTIWNTCSIIMYSCTTFPCLDLELYQYVFL